MASFVPSPKLYTLPTDQAVELELTDLGASQKPVPPSEAANDNAFITIQLNDLETSSVVPGALASRMPVWIQAFLGVLMAVDILGTCGWAYFAVMLGILSLPFGYCLFFYALLMLVALGLVVAAPCSRSVPFGVVRTLAILAMIGHLLIGIFIATLPPIHGRGDAGALWPLSLPAFGLAIIRIFEFGLLSRAKRYSNFGQSCNC